MWREVHSRPRGAALAPNAGRRAWDHHSGWMTMESILPKKAAPPSPGGDEKHACSIIIGKNLDPAFVHARPGTFVRVATVQAL
jgi:hypothetical protein